MSNPNQNNTIPAAELERQIMNPNVPKNEREWWAAAEIARLRQDNDRLRAEIERLRAALASSQQLSFEQLRRTLEPKP